MYTLLHGLYKYLMQKDEYFVLILGLDNAGKTVGHSRTYRGYDVRTAIIDYFQTYLEAAKTKFTKNYKGMNPSKITTTVGLNIGKIDIAGVSFNFWDLGGQEELQSLWDKVIKEAQDSFVFKKYAFFMIFSGTDIYISYEDRIFCK